MCLKPLVNSGGAVLNGHLWANADNCPLLTLHGPGLSGWSCISGCSHQGVGVSSIWLGQPLSPTGWPYCFVGWGDREAPLLGVPLRARHGAYVQSGLREDAELAPPHPLGHLAGPLPPPTPPVRPALQPSCQPSSGRKSFAGLTSW